VPVITFLIALAFTGPVEEIDPAKLSDG